MQQGWNREGRADIMKKIDIQTNYVRELTEAYRTEYPASAWRFPKELDPRAPTAEEKEAWRRGLEKSS